MQSYELIACVFDGQSEGLTRDDILDNITITWLTNTALSGARLYWENWGKVGYFKAKGVSIAVAVSVFPDELCCSTQLGRAGVTRLPTSRPPPKRRLQLRGRGESDPSGESEDS